MLKHKADPNAGTGSPTAAPMFPMEPRCAVAGNSPLHLAALFGHTNVIPVLLNSGALVNATNSTGRTALDLTRQSGFLLGPVWLQFGLPTRSEPPGVGETAPRNPYGSWVERQKAAASLLEKSGAKRSRVKRPGAGPFWPYEH